MIFSEAKGRSEGCNVAHPLPFPPQTHTAEKYHSIALASRGYQYVIVRIHTLSLRSKMYLKKVQKSGRETS